MPESPSNHDQTLERLDNQIRGTTFTAADNEGLFIR